MVGTFLGLASIVGIALLTGIPLIGGLRRGVIYSKRIGYSRVEDPRSFWFFAGGYTIAFLASAGLLAYFAVGALMGR
jgi:hypothetical protein